MPSSTTLYSNWTGVGFRPGGGPLIPINRVQSVGFDPGSQLIPYSGDGDRYPVGLFNLSNQPSAVVVSNNIGALLSIPPGTVGTLVATLNDARNGALADGGAITFTLDNAVVQNAPTSARHAQIADGSVTFLAFSSDGVTSPFSYALVTS